MERAATSSYLERSESYEPLGDPRFRRLLSAADWAALPLAIRRRFSKRVLGGESTVYRGQILECRMSGAGWWLAQLGRLIGAPLPLSRNIGIPAVVTVTEDVSTTGQHWTRLYAGRGTFPQIIHSSKRFAGPTGLEEHIGCGVGMALRLEARPDALLFHSVGYFVALGPIRLVLPRLLWPGILTVTHKDLGHGSFLFALSLVHPRLGEIFYQAGTFTDSHPSRATVFDGTIDSASATDASRWSSGLSYTA